MLGKVPQRYREVSFMFGQLGKIFVNRSPQPEGLNHYLIKYSLRHHHRATCIRPVQESVLERRLPHLHFQRQRLERRGLLHREVLDVELYSGCALEYS